MRGLCASAQGESSLGDLAKLSAVQQSQIRAWKQELLPCFLMSFSSKKLHASFLSQDSAYLSPSRAVLIALNNPFSSELGQRTLKTRRSVSVHSRTRSPIVQTHPAGLSWEKHLSSITRGRSEGSGRAALSLSTATERISRGSTPAHSLVTCSR